MVDTEKWSAAMVNKPMATNRRNNAYSTVIKHQETTGKTSSNNTNTHNMKRNSDYDNHQPPTYLSNMVMVDHEHH